MRANKLRLKFDLVSRYLVSGNFVLKRTERTGMEFGGTLSIIVVTGDSSDFYGQENL